MPDVALHAGKSARTQGKRKTNDKWINKIQDSAKEMTYRDSIGRHETGPMDRLEGFIE